jgi:dTDP-4-amino-4,6-dideoxygalactose transaminase
MTGASIATTYRIPFNRPTTASESVQYVREVLDSGPMAGNGPFTRRAESILEAVSGSRKALLTSSCTAALEMSAQLLDAGPGDEVIVPSFTFVSTANAFAVHGLRPVFADCRPDTLNVDAATLLPHVGPRTRAVVVMHYGGVACEMDEILALSRQHGFTVIEDNAHGLFGAYKGRPLGSLGSMATQSFHETKNVTCGEGGALLLNDLRLVGRAEILREKGTNRSRFFRGEVDKYTWVDRGSNYLASELQSACLVGQLETRAAVQAKRCSIWQRYDQALKDWARANGVRLPVVPAHCEHPSHLYYVLLPDPSARPALIEHLKKQGMLAVFHYIPLHLSPMGQRLGGTAGACPVAEDVSERLLRLPFYTDMSAGDQAAVIDAVCQFRV